MIGLALFWLGLAWLALYFFGFGLALDWDWLGLGMAWLGLACWPGYMEYGWVVPVYVLCKF